MTNKPLKYKPLLLLLLNAKVKWNNMNEDQIMDVLKGAFEVDKFIYNLCNKYNISYEIVNG